MISRLLLVSATILVSATLHAAESPLALRVMTFNIRYINPGDTGNRTWQARRDQVAEVMRADHPDIIGVQEAFRSMLDDIAERLPGYQEIGVGREDGKTTGEYSAILFRKERFAVIDSGTFWLSDTPEIPNSRTWKNRVTRICTWAKLEEKATGRSLVFYNTHFDHESQEAREKSVHLILKRVAAQPAGTPFVVTGDFNAGEDNPAITAMKAGPPRLVDAWRELHPEVPLHESGTMSRFTGALDSGKIDYLFVPAGTRVIDAEILRSHREGVYPSDHYPVRASVEFPTD
jgi:endonuclease/exonuclease/phosphatase family metal-dependent hydrolase